jgi:hypothetical protein
LVLFPKTAKKSQYLFKLAQPLQRFDRYIAYSNLVVKDCLKCKQKTGLSVIVCGICRGERSLLDQQKQLFRLTLDMTSKATWV